MNPQTIRILTKVFCIYGPNLEILTWTGEKLSRRHARTNTRTHGQTDAGNDNARRANLASDKNQQTVTKT